MRNKIKNPRYLNDCNHQCLIDIGYRFGLRITSDTYHALYRCYWIDSTLDEQLFAANIFLNSDQTPKSNKISVHLTARDIMYHQINHPNVASIQHIVKFYHKPNQTKCMCITELSDAGNLSTKLETIIRLDKRLPNGEELLNWCSQIARGLAYLHSNGISHNNLKPTKILFFFDNQISGEFRLKITDYIESTEKSTANSDKNLYKHPSIYSNKEVVNAFDAKKTDIWSLAVIIAELIIGSKKMLDIFKKNNNNENISIIYMKKVKNKKYDTLLIDLLGKMFDNDHHKRLSAVQVCKHKWMSNEIHRQRNEDFVIKTEDNVVNFTEIDDNEDKLVVDSDEELLSSPTVFDSKNNYDLITDYSIIRKITKK